MSRRREGAPPAVVVSFGLTVVCAVGFAVSYGLDLGSVALGGTLGAAFAFLALGLVIWSQLIDDAEPEYVEERDIGPSAPSEFAAFEAALTEQPVPRSRVLWSMLTLAGGSIGVAALFPLRSLFPEEGGNPDTALSHTEWLPGRLVVDEEGRKVRPEDLDYGGVLTAYPEGVGIHHVDAATLLLRVDPDLLRLPPERMDWTVRGVVAYSKLCTHAGCPVALYADSYAELLCPCHHSIFDVLTGANPVQGPASRPLPQLPLDTDDEGFLVARGDFSDPVGAGWWGYSR